MSPSTRAGLNRIDQLDQLARTKHVTWLSEPHDVYLVNGRIQSRIGIEYPVPGKHGIYTLSLLCWSRPLVALSYRMSELYAFALDAWPGCDIEVTEAAKAHALEPMNERGTDIRFAEWIQTKRSGG